MRYEFIINPKAGKKSAEEWLFPKVREYFESHHLSYGLNLTKYSGHATEITRAIAEGGEEVRVIAMGGDGTLCEVANGAVNHSNVTAGVLPCGSGNDYIRMFGTKDDFLDIDRMVNGTAYPVDMIENDRINAMNICCAGIDAAVALNMVKYKKMPLVSGSMAYNLALVRAFFGKIGNQLRLTIDGQLATEGKYLLTAVANGCSYGGGYYASPNSIVNDGLLDVIMIRVPKTRFLIPILLKAYKEGKHLTDPRFKSLLQVFQGKEIQIEAAKPMAFTADGECDLCQSRTYTVIEKVIHFLVPQGCSTECLKNVETVVASK